MDAIMDRTAHLDSIEVSVHDRGPQVPRKTVTAFPPGSATGRRDGTPVNRIDFHVEA
ncbi:hypothetical protein [Streptomyces sp. NBC_01353]|uniref:hypothetical protein n=1 Tax=Streptomyces sp. NBC_01353 TaxID=2903835 RepID=UPI002E331C14|nr:hypothetical protein [Streptomyces sp. NBC_01353]